MNEGHLGTFSFGGERAATDNHPAVIQYLPLAESVKAPIAVGTLLRAVNVYGATAAVSGSGVTGATVKAATFANKVEGKTGKYEFSYDTSWKLEQQEATIADYGIEVSSGSATSGDKITVTLTVDGIDFAPLSSTDTAEPCAVADLPCDPTGEKGEKSVAAVVHGTVNTRLLKTSDNKAPTPVQLAVLAKHGVFAV